MEREQAIKYMRDLLKLMVDKKGSDLFITVDFPPAIKIDGKVTPVSKTQLTAENTKALAYAIMNDRQLKEFEATKECNFAICANGYRSIPRQHVCATESHRDGFANHRNRSAHYRPAGPPRCHERSRND